MCLYFNVYFEIKEISISNFQIITKINIIDQIQKFINKEDNSLKEESIESKCLKLNFNLINEGLDDFYFNCNDIIVSKSMIKETLSNKCQHFDEVLKRKKQRYWIVL